MTALFSEIKNNSQTCSRDPLRLERYQTVLIPSLRRAAPWLSQTNESSMVENGYLQLLFDFVTMSSDSLKPIRTVRDGTLRQVSKRNHTVRTIKVVNHNCRRNDTLAARTIHGTISVPWWLVETRRDSVLSSVALKSGRTDNDFEANFVVIVPCSLRAAALNDTRRIQRPLRAIVEYGHGLFYNRAEAYGHSLKRFVVDVADGRLLECGNHSDILSVFLFQSC